MMLQFFPPVYCVNNGDNYTKLFTLFGYFIRRIHRRPMGTVAAHRLALELEAICQVDDKINGCTCIFG
jgi:hypothetical protein